MKSAPQNNTRITLNSHSIKTAITLNHSFCGKAVKRRAPGAYISM
ncbi:hypothetical protein ACPAVH_12425 [Enterobacteriaceae bacterium TYF_5]